MARHRFHEFSQINFILKISVYLRPVLLVSGLFAGAYAAVRGFLNAEHAEHAEVQRIAEGAFNFRNSNLFSISNLGFRI